eukprot:2984881-Pleurochrysis_carterae.AAC.1
MLCKDKRCSLDTCTTTKKGDAEVVQTVKSTNWVVDTNTVIVKERSQMKRAAGLTKLWRERVLSVD